MNAQLTRKEFEAIKSKFVELSDEQTFTREVGFCLTIVSANPQLQGVSKESLLRAVYSVSSVGLSLNPVKKEAYLVTRYNRALRAKEACLEPSYQGLVKLVTDTGSVKNIYCHVVYKGDVFDVSLGTSVELTHKPKFESKEVEKVYAVAVLPTGEKQVEVMSVSDIHEIRERSDSYKAFKDGKISSCVWDSDFSEMCRKTVIRRIVKYLPKTESWEKVSKAVNLDEQDYKATMGTVNLIEGLLSTSSLGEQEKDAYYNLIIDDSLTSTQANKIIEYLKDNQRDPIESGDNYSMSDIGRKLRSIQDEGR